ncbi:MAG: AraC family transcriptional regulator, partial [Giesbergeria sp.]
MMLLLLPDAVHHLTGIDPKDWMNRMVDVGNVLPEDWLKMCRSVAADQDDGQRVSRIEDFLRPRWQVARPKRPLGLHRYADWATGVALHAATSRTGRSLRQVERRILRWAGQPLRELKGF